MRPVRSPSVRDLFVEPDGRPSPVRGDQDTRPIARNPAPPRHVATSLVPEAFLRPLGRDVSARQSKTFTATLHAAKRMLGEPFYAQDGYILYNTDSLAAMELLKRAAFQADLILTSPPYNIGKAYESIIAVEEYVSWSERWMAAAYGITSLNGAFWLNLGYFQVPGKGRAVPISYLLWDKTRYHLVQELVWNYGAGVAAKKSFSPRNEKWLFFAKDPDVYTFNLDEVRDPNVKYPNQKKNGKFRCNPLGKNPSDVWTFPKVTTGTKRSSKERTGHPAQFPLGVVERIVRVSSDVGAVVVDPFAGSGSSGIASAALGRVFLGFEISREYCKMAIDRFDDFRAAREQAARDLFLPS